ncbi:MAG: PP2C family protein-serine/threonine phosphatase [Pirellulales bacterium]|nr:PP2C family protein-serine/threonine phosphatase [Pirellulales bacterium]
MDTQQRLEQIVETVRNMSRQTDAQEVVRDYGERMKSLVHRDSLISLSRRGLEYPYFRVTRCTRWTEDVNPWKEPHRLPLFKGGLLADLIYQETPRLLEDYSLAPDEPAIEYLQGFRLLSAIPHFHGGVATNMVITLHKDPASFERDRFPEMVLTSNLFGRATYNLVLADELKTAYEALDHEFQIVGDIQRALLPAELPRIDGLEMAAHYQTSRRAGGDYYDFFPLPGGCWGIFIADVSGHGTPAATVMAITHAVAHAFPGPPTPPAEMLNFLNQKLTGRFMSRTSSFVTAFYAIFDPQKRELTYACAGHNPPRLRRAGQILPLDQVAGLPIGVDFDHQFQDQPLKLETNDLILFYTDGITEAFNSQGQMFGVPRLDASLAAGDASAEQVVSKLVEQLDAFCAGQPVSDDRTLLALRVR